MKTSEEFRQEANDVLGIEFARIKSAAVELVEENAPIRTWVWRASHINQEVTGHRGLELHKSAAKLRRELDKLIEAVEAIERFGSAWYVADIEEES